MGAASLDRVVSEGPFKDRRSRPAIFNVITPEQSGLR